MGLDFGEGPRRERVWRTHLLAGFLIVLFSIAFYQARSFNEFDYDDYRLIVLNPSIRELKTLPTVLVSGRPVRGVTLMIDYALYGLNASGYHFTNFLWHVFGAGLFYLLVFRLTGRGLTAVVAAVLFSLHPVHSDAVMSISHRKEMLAFNFMTLAFLCFIGRAKRSDLGVGLSIVFFLLALLSKQVAVVLPALILVHALLFREGPIDFKRASLRLLPLVVIVGVLFGGGILVTAPVLRDFDPFVLFKPAEFFGVSYPKILATSFGALPLTLRFLIFPVHHNLDPQIQIISFAQPRAWLGLGLFLGLIFAAVRWRRQPVLSFSVWWLVINLVPIMNFTPANYSFAERYLYIPSAGVCLLFAYGWTRLYDLPGPILSRLERSVAGAVLSFAILVLFVSSFTGLRFSLLWDPSQSARMPGPIAAILASMAVALVGVALFQLLDKYLNDYFHRRLWLELIFAYLIFLLLFVLALVGTEGLIHGRLGFPAINFVRHWKIATEYFALHGWPGLPEAASLPPASAISGAELFYLLAFIIGGPCVFFVVIRWLVRRGAASGGERGVAWALLSLVVFAGEQAQVMRNLDWSSRVMLWERTVADAPGSVNGWNNLGAAYVDRRRWDRAVFAYERLAALTPQDPRALIALAEAYRVNGRAGRSEATYLRLLQISPRDFVAANNLANLLLDKARADRDLELVKKAIPYYLQALEVNPDYTPSLRGIAIGYLLLGDFDLALKRIDRVIALDPNDQEAAALRTSIIEHLNRRR